MANAARKPQMVVVLGATGTGKSKLAVELASEFNGEIINADAVQMYRGLPIVTNKIPIDERRGVPHHLIDRIGLEERPWTVHEFVDESVKVIDDIHARGKLPVVVGGTNYYVFSLLFKDTTITAQEFSTGSDDETDDSFARLSKEELYAKLQQVDPVIARTLHPNDSRKVLRALEIWQKTGTQASKIYADQKLSKSANSDSASENALRYDPIIFWLDAEVTALRLRLSTRVGSMIEQGLLDEVRTMHQVNQKLKLAGAVDQSHGIWVSIGYKEFASWLEALETGDTSNLKELQKEAIEAVDTATRQYAKRQDRWLRRRFAQALQGAHSLNRMFLLDGTDLSRWPVCVSKPSRDIVHKFCAGRALPTNSSLSERAAKVFEQIQACEQPERQSFVCDTCQKTMMSEAEWQRHVKSAGHKKVLDGIRKRAQRDLYLAGTAQAARE